MAATTRQESYEYDSNTMVSVADSDLLGSVIEDDQVTLYAEVVGSTSHDTQIGNTTVLHLDAGVVVVR